MAFKIFTSIVLGIFLLFVVVGIINAILDFRIKRLQKKLEEQEKRNESLKFISSLIESINTLNKNNGK